LLEQRINSLNKQIKWLKISYTVEMIIGFLMGGFLALMVGVMATDSPTSSDATMYIAGSVTFIIVAVPTIILPLFALKELEDYESSRKLRLNITNSVILIVIGGIGAILLLPIGVAQFFFISELKKNPLSELH